MVVSENTNKIILYAQEEAGRLQSACIEPAHLLLAIIRLGEGSAYELLEQAKFEPEKAKEALEQFVSGEDERINRPLSSSCERIFRIAEGISREYHSEAVSSAHMLLAILRERLNKTAAYLEREWKITYSKIVELYGEPHETISYTQEVSEPDADTNESGWQPQRETAKGKKKTTH